jgi:ketosteroid isomerase-like protein
MEIAELLVHGDWAHAWSRLEVTATPSEGAAPVRRSGHTLSIFRKEPSGSWVLARDANLLVADTPST